LLAASLQQSREGGLLDEGHDLAAVDSTCLESRHVSEHYLHRIGKENRCYHKLAEVVDVGSHLCLSHWCGMGPSPDQPHLRVVMRRAKTHHPALAGVVADAGYDGERYQRYLFERLGVVGIVKHGGRPIHDPHQRPGGFHRGLMAEHWPQHLYNQRAQVETRISMHKRLLGSHLTARKKRTRTQQMWLRSITLNLMIIAEAVT
jgi:hypothetical protein